MKIAECVALAEKLKVNVLTWEFNNCEIDELRDTYVPNGEETHVALCKPEYEYIVNRIKSVFGKHDKHELVALRLHKDYLLYVIADADGPLKDEEE